MAPRQNGTIIPEKECSNYSTPYSFYVIESRVSSKCTYKVDRISMPEKKGKPKRKHGGKDCKRATDSKVYACSDIDLAEVLFHYEIFCDKENRNLSSDIYRVPFDGISKDLLDR